MAFLDKVWWNSFLLKLEKRLAARAKILEVDAVAVGGLTEDNTWQTFDATTITSAKAKWIHLTVEWDGTGTQTTRIEFRKTGRTNAQQKCYYKEVGSGASEMSWNLWVAMDDQQQFDYKIPAAGTPTITCTGYIETGLQW